MTTGLTPAVGNLPSNNTGPYMAVSGNMSDLMRVCVWARMGSYVTKVFLSPSADIADLRNSLKHYGFPILLQMVDPSQLIVYSYDGFYLHPQQKLCEIPLDQPLAVEVSQIDPVVGVALKPTLSVKPTSDESVRQQQKNEPVVVVVDAKQNGVEARSPSKTDDLKPKSVPEPVQKVDSKPKSVSGTAEPVHKVDSKPKQVVEAAPPVPVQVPKNDSEKKGVSEPLAPGQKDELKQKGVEPLKKQDATPSGGELKPVTESLPRGAYASALTHSVTTKAVVTPVALAQPAKKQDAVPPVSKECSICGEVTHASRECFKFKTKVCSFWLKGLCHNPTVQCTFAHGKAELREPWALKCQSVINGIVIGCGGTHIFTMCKKRYCETCKTEDHWYGSKPDCIRCKKCAGSHLFEQCPQAYCHVCRSSSHWTKFCLICRFCKSLHPSQTCPYMVFRSS